MTAPVRIQLSRKKGWRMPENTVKVDRATKWGNPFEGDASIAVYLFRKHLHDEFVWCPVPVRKWPKGKIPAIFTSVTDVRRELAGKNLACWCALDKPCHADVLLELANKELK
jgi:hypothetical protein